MERAYASCTLGRLTADSKVFVSDFYKSYLRELAKLSTHFSRRKVLLLTPFGEQTDTESEWIDIVDYIREFVGRLYAVCLVCGFTVVVD